MAILPFVAGITGAAALHPHHFAGGFRNAMIIAGLACAAGGLLAAATIRNPRNAPRTATHRHPRYSCALDGTPLPSDGAADDATTDS